MSIVIQDISHNHRSRALNPLFWVSLHFQVKIPADRKALPGEIRGFWWGVEGSHLPRMTPSPNMFAVRPLQKMVGWKMKTFFLGSLPTFSGGYERSV